MFLRDPAGLRRVCVVAHTERGLTAACGGRTWRLADLDPPPAFRVPNLHASCGDESDRVRHALDALHREHGFDAIEFPARGGVGFRAVQAKAAGLALDGVELAVRLDSCAAWEREQESRWTANYAEVEADFAERFAFEHADTRVFEVAALAAFVAGLGWQASRASHGTGEHQHPPVHTGGSPGGSPGLVTVGISHFNLGRHLPDTLASLAAQTYPHLDIIVIDDGSTCAESRAVFDGMERRYPQWRFLRQPNAGIGATRNRCLDLARGEFFVPFDADNLARPEMIETFVTAVRRNPDCTAMTCYFQAFTDTPDRPTHAHRPTGGPHILAAVRNVYGDATAVFRTAEFRAAGGYATDRGTSCEDWEAFAKLAGAGHRIGVVPDHLFFYRHLPTGFSRRTNWFANHQRVLRPFADAELDPAEAAALWTALLGFHQRIEQFEAARPPLRHRVADALYAPFARFPRLVRGVKRALAAAANVARRPAKVVLPYREVRPAPRGALCDS